LTIEVIFIYKRNKLAHKNYLMAVRRWLTDVNSY